MAYSVRESTYIGVAVPRALKEQLIELAERHQATLSEEVRAALEQHVSKWTPGASS